MRRTDTRAEEARTSPGEIPTGDLPETLFRDRGRPLAEAIASAPGIRGPGPDGNLRLRLGNREARIQLGAGGWGRVTVPVSDSRDERDLLQESAELPANVRFVMPAGRTAEVHLIADWRTSRASELADTLSELRAGFAQALRLEAARQRPALDAPSITDALEHWRAQRSDQDASGNAVVSLEDGWELRFRILESRVRLQVVHEDHDLRLEAKLLSAFPEGVSAQAIAAEALRLNAEVRLARLTLRDGALFAETRLSLAALARGGLGNAAIAVGAALRHAQPLVQIIRQEPHVADACVETHSTP